MKNYQNTATRRGSLVMSLFDVLFQILFMGTLVAIVSAANFALMHCCTTSRSQGSCGKSKAAGQELHSYSPGRVQGVDSLAQAPLL